MYMMRVMTKALVIAAMFRIGCIHADRIALATSLATTAMDWKQTRCAAGRGWAHTYESGMPARAMIGETPSQRAVDLYFVGATAANIALWAVLPPKWRAIAPGIVTGIELRTVVGNLDTTRGCL